MNWIKFWSVICSIVVVGINIGIVALIHFAFITDNKILDYSAAFVAGTMLSIIACNAYNGAKERFQELMEDE